MAVALMALPMCRPNQLAVQLFRLTLLAKDVLNAASLKRVELIITMDWERVVKNQIALVGQIEGFLRTKSHENDVVIAMGLPQHVTVAWDVFDDVRTLMNGRGGSARYKKELARIGDRYEDAMMEASRILRNSLGLPSINAYGYAPEFIGPRGYIPF